jgi:hypothetical protein
MTEEAPECCRRSFAASIKDTASRLLKDPTIAPRAVAADRMAICEGCGRFREETKTCEICGCFLPLKTAAANMECPIGKWTEWKRGNDVH